MAPAAKSGIATRSVAQEKTTIFSHLTFKYFSLKYKMLLERKGNGRF